MHLPKFVRIALILVWWTAVPLILANWIAGAMFFGADRFFGWTDSALLNRGYNLTVENKRGDLVRISLDEDEFSRLAEEVGLRRGTTKILVTDLTKICGQAGFLDGVIKLDARCVLQIEPGQVNRLLLHEISYLVDPTNPFSVDYLKYGAIGGIISTFGSSREKYAEEFAEQHREVDLISVIPADPSGITWYEVTEDLPWVGLALSGQREEAIIQVRRQGDEIVIDASFDGGDLGGAKPICGDKIWLNAVPYRTEFIWGACRVVLPKNVAGNDLTVQYKGYLLGIHLP